MMLKCEKCDFVWGTGKKTVLTGLTIKPTDENVCQGSKVAHDLGLFKHIEIRLMTLQNYHFKI